MLVRFRERPDAICDVHVARLAGRPREWLDRCLRSLEDEPVNWYLIDAVPGSVGSTRAHGFAFGRTPYRASVDDDDYVMPGAFRGSVALMEADPRIASTYTDWRTIDESGAVLREHVIRNDYDPLRHLGDRHLVAQLHVYRRAQLAPHLDGLRRWHNHDQQWLTARLTAQGWHRRVPRPLYAVRMHRLPRASRQRSDRETRECMAEIRPILEAAPRSLEQYGAA